MKIIANITRIDDRHMPMTQLGLDLNLLTVFEALLTEASVTRAGRRLGLGQPAISAALGRLRVAFDDPLFVRAGGAMRPTAKANEIAPRIALALGAVREALAAAAPFAPAKARRRFTVVASDYATMVVMPALLETLRRDAPFVDLRILGLAKEAVAGQLDRTEADLVIGTFHDPPPRAVETPLYEDRFVGICRRDHPGLAGDAIGLDGFTQFPHALFTLNSDMKGEIDTALSRIGRARRVAVSVPHLLTLPALLARTDLLAAIPARLADLVCIAPIRSFDLPVDPGPWAVSMLWNPATRGDPALSWLRGLFRRLAVPREAGGDHRVEGEAT